MTQDHDAIIERLDRIEILLRLVAGAVVEHPSEGAARIALKSKLQEQPEGPLEPSPGLGTQRKL